MQIDAGFSTFVTKLTLWLMALFAVYYFGIESNEFANDYAEWHAQMASSILNNVMGEQTEIHRLSNGLLSEIRTHDVAYIRVVPAGEGYFALCFLAAILAWPSSSGIKKSFFLLGAVFLSAALHMFHTIFSLQFEIWWKNYFDLWVMIGSPITITLIAMLYFFWWIKVSGKHPMQPNE